MNTTNNPVAAPRIKRWIHRCQEMRASATGAPAASNSKASITTYLANGKHSLSSAEQTEILAAVAP